MKVAVFSSKPYDEKHLSEIQQSRHEFTYFDTQLNVNTAKLAEGFDAVCCFVNDSLDRAALQGLKDHHIHRVVLRCAGFNNLDVPAAEAFGIKVARVPDYSPYAVAEHAVALVMDLNRNIHRSYQRVRENDYSLNGLLGFDVHGKTVGVVGAGKIGVSFARIMKGFGCKIIASDPYPNEAMAEMAEFVPLEQIWTDSDIISLHCPLMDATHHLINEHTIELMKKGVMVINTSRGGLIDTKAVIEGLKKGQIGYLGLDVYEEEQNLFFENYSNEVLLDDVFARLLTFKNVVITGHQAFFTQEALKAIASVTMANLDGMEANTPENVQWVVS